MQTTPEDKDAKLADDLLVGARAIAAELGLTESQIYYLAGSGRLPIGRMGKQLISLKSKLRSATKALINTA
jgi:hypothetical protein